MRKKRRNLWPLFSLLLAIGSIWAVVAQSGKWSLQDMLESLREANPLYLTAAVLCAAMFVVMEGLAVRRLLKSVGIGKSRLRGVLYSAADVYFSAITPSATGGQPASAFFMIADGVPAGTATVVLMSNLILYTLAMLVTGTACAVFGWRRLFGFQLVSKLLIGAGFAVLAGLSLLFLLMLVRGDKAFSVMRKLFDWLGRIGWIRRKQSKLQRLDSIQSDFESCVSLMRGKTKGLLLAFLCNLGQRVSQIAVPVFFYLALGGRAARAGSVFAAQCFATIGYSIVPIPGAMGVADYLMLDAFSELVGSEEAVRLEMLSRGLSFYLCVLASALITALGTLSLRRKNREEAAE